MQTQFNIHEAKSQLSRLIEQVEAGGEAVIARAGKPIAKLCPYEPDAAAARRRLGRDRGLFEVPDDFDAPLPDEVLELFER